MYEIIFKYHEKGEDGEFNKEDTKEKKVKIGTIDEEVPLEQVAGKIIAQLARKKISVVEVKIYEYTKKELNFKEIDDGFKIGKRKFSFEDGALLTGSSDDESSEQEQIMALLKNNPQLIAQLTGQQPGKMSIVTPSQPMQQSPRQAPALIPNNSNTPAQRYEVFDPVAAPEGATAAQEIIKRRGWKFTVGKRYPIFQEKMGSNPIEGMLYSTVDDAGVRLDIRGFYFIPMTRGLTGNFLEDTGGRPVGDDGREPKLMFQSGSKYDMPALRGGGGGGGGGPSPEAGMPDIRKGKLIG